MAASPLAACGSSARRDESDNVTRHICTMYATETEREREREREHRFLRFFRCAERRGASLGDLVPVGTTMINPRLITEIADDPGRRESHPLLARASSSARVPRTFEDRSR